MKRLFAGLIPRRPIAATVAAVLLSGTALLTASAAPPAQGPVSIAFEKYELANGLDVILHEDHSTPTVAVNVWYHVGSKNEKRGRTGFAHLFEHMMFQGSEHHPGEFFAPLEKLGANINGSTSEDRTNYFEDVPANALELALWLESDRMGFLLPAMTQESLDNQRDVVKNERRQGVDNEPYGRAFELLGEMIYPPEHPYSWSVIGSMADLSAASMEDVSEFFRTYYTPSNASLCIAGDFDPKVAKALVEKYFGAIPPGRTIDRLQSWVPRLDTVKRAVSTDNVNLPRVYMAWPTPALFAPGDSHFDLLANALSSGKTSRLYKSLVYDKQIAQDIQAVQFSGGIASSFNIIATASEGHTLDEVEAAIDAELRRVLAEGITAEELAQAQTAWEASFVRRIEPVGSFGGRADLLNQYNTMLGDPGRVGWDLDRYLKVNVAEVQQYAKRYIDLDRRVILRIVPQGELTAAADSGLDRTREPGLGPEPSFTPPTIQRASLANGMQILLVEDHDLPLVQANVVIRSGWGSDPTERLGTAALTAAVLDEGTKTRSALQIAEESKRLGAALGTDSGFDSTEVSVNVLKRNLDPALDLMADIVLNATFPAEEMERQRQLTLGQIAQESKEPFPSAVNTFMQELYGPGHPYGQPFTGTGTEASVRALTRDDLAAFHRAWFAPDNAAIVFSGDITLEEARTRVDRVFRAWKKGNITPKAVPAPPSLASTRIVLVDKPGAAQSFIVAGHTGMPRKAADFLAFEVMNNALGSQFSSRINMNLREDKGYSYGAGSVLLPTRGVGPFACFAPVQTQNTKESVVEIVKEMKDVIGSRPLANDELTDSRNNLIKGFPQRFEGIGSIAGQLSSMFIHELPADEWATYTKRVAAIDGPTATKAAKDHLHPQALLIVVVGDREKVEAGLKELKLGPVEVAKGE